MQAPLIADPFYVQPQDPPSKKAVLRAALALFVANGIAATTVRDIAAAAEFSNPVIFKYFPTRDALALHLFEVCFRQFSQRLERATAPHLPIARRLQGLLEVYAQSVQENTAAFLYVHENWRALGPLMHEELRAFSLPRRVRKLLHEAQLVGVLDSALDLDLAATALSGVFVAVARHVAADEVFAEPESLLAMARRILRL